MKHKILLQVTTPAIVTGLVLVVTGLGSAWSIHRLQANLASILHESVVSVQASFDLENSTRQMRYHSLLYLIRPTPEGLRQIDIDESRFEAAFTLAEGSATSIEEVELLREIRSGYRRYRAEMTRLQSGVARTGPRTDYARLAELHPIRHITTPCQQLGRLNLEQLEQTAVESYALSSRWRMVLLLLGLAGPLGGLIAGYGITLGISRSITKLHVRVREVVDRLGPLRTTPRPDRDSPAVERDGIQVTLTADGDLGAIERQLDQVVHRAEEMVGKLQRQQREILRAEQMAALGQLAASVAHEVRNPLTGMKLLVEAALRPSRRQSLSEEDLRVIHGEIARLEEIVRHFLDYARPQPLVRRIGDLREVVTRPVELVRTRARQQGVTVQVELPADPLPADLDTSQLESVLVNLLLNALDALPHGGEIVLEARELTGEGHARPAGVLEIRDNGPGIHEDLLPRLFTPFASGKATGTGLGLSLARRIVEEHGGRLEATNLPGGGACFTLVLPLALPQETSCPASW